MSGSVKLGLTILAAVVAFYVISAIVRSLLIVAVVVGVVLVVGGLISGSKPLGGNRRFLP